MDIYREAILDHYKNPRNFGHLKNPDAKIEEGNVTCGDRITIEINIKGSSEKHLDKIVFSGEGCAISQASASMLTEKVKGMTINEILNIDTQTIITMLGTTLTPSRTRCATLALEVLHKAVTQITPLK